MSTMLRPFQAANDILRPSFAICRLLTAAFTMMLLANPAQAVIEEIVVTAQKREQSLQDVPIAVSAYDSETLRRAGIEDIRDLQQLSPSLVLTSTQSETAGTTARIRGVGTTGDNLGLESSVAVFVDGVYRNRNSVALTDLGEVERIEVLRGPQGTLFGKNASAGLIHVITKGPDLSEFGGYAGGSIGDYNDYRVSAGVTGPIIRDSLGYRLEGSWNQRDGFIDDIANGDDYNDRDRFQLRGQLASEIGAISLRFIADYAKRDETCCAAVTDVAGPTAAIINGLTPLTGFQPLGTVIAPGQPFERKTTVTKDIGYTSKVDEYGASLQLDWEFGPGDLTSITSYRNWESDRSQDLDYSDAEILYRPLGGYGNDFKTFTQELRYAWQMGDFDLMVGAYYVNEELDVLDGIRVGSDYQTYVNALLLVSGEATLPPGSFVDGQGAQVDSFQQDTDSWALFTHNTWNVTDRLGLTLGLRYTDETKDVTGTLIADNPACLAVAAGNPAGLGPVGRSLVCLPLISPLVDAPNNALLGNVGPYQGSRSDNEWTGTFVADYQFGEEWLGYASYSRGYKAGGYNLDRAGFNNPNPAQGIFPSTMDLEFSPETVDSYELGAKATLADGRLRVNLAAFYAEFQDFQLNTFTGTNFIVTNLDKVESKGVELETTAFITDGLTLTGGVTYNDARYGDNVSDPTLAGKQLTNAPEWVFTAATDYEWPIAGNLLGYTHLDFRFTGEHNTGSNLAPEKRQAGAAVWNGAVGVAGDERSWEVELWVRNLFDRDYRQVVFDAPLQNGSYNAFLGDPRVWGVRGRINF